MRPAMQEAVEGDAAEGGQAEAHVGVGGRATELARHQPDELLRVGGQELSQRRILLGLDQEPQETPHGTGIRDRSVHREPHRFGTLLTVADLTEVVGHMLEKPIGKRHQQIGPAREIVGEVRLPNPQDSGHLGLGQALWAMLPQNFSRRIDDALA